MATYYFDKDASGNPIMPVVILANRNGDKVGSINIDEKSLTIKVALEDSSILLSEMSCDMHKYINTYKNPLWDSVKNFKLIFIPINIPHIKSRGLWYEIEVNIDESDDTIKHITGTLFHYAELSHVNNYDVQIRTQEDMERDDYVDTIFYNPNNPDASIIHRILKDKASHYSIYHVDNSLKNIKRTFEFNGNSLIDNLKEVCEEVGCIIIFGESSGTDLDIHRSISFYDAKDYCPECGKRGDFADGCTNPDCTHSQAIVFRYGDDSGIFINKENLGESITLSTNTDNIINCYRLTAGDDDMTAAIVNCNPSGSRYIWNFTDEMKQDMSVNLRTRINSYITSYNQYKYTSSMSGITSTMISQYNTLVNKYQDYIEEELDTYSHPIRGYMNMTLVYYSATYLRDMIEMIMMPDSPDVEDTTAQIEIAKYTQTRVGVRSLTSVSRTSSAQEVKESVALYVDDSRYSINATTTSYSNNTWQGSITLTSLTDEDDTATVTKTLTFTQATADYIAHQVEKYIKQKEAIVKSVKDLLNLSLSDYTDEIEKYCLDYLSQLLSVIDAVLAIMDDAGITQSSDPDVYQQIYVPYSQKRTKTTQELSVRETEVSRLNNLITAIEAQEKTINTALDLKTYLGNTLWLELCSFRREKEYENTSFISDGLSNAELIQNAKDFYDRAEEEIEKEAETQYSISCNLKNLLVLLPDTYDQRLHVFDVGNWMRIEADDRIYKLQLISYQISFNDLSHIDVEFSEAKSSNDIISSFRKASNNLKKGLTDVSKEVKNISTAESPIIIEITSSEGLVFKKNKVDTILTCQVKRGNEDITNKVINFNWKKYDRFGALDENWSRGNINSITLSSSDVNSKAVFRCEVTIAD